MEYPRLISELNSSSGGRLLLPEKENSGSMIFDNPEKYARAANPSRPDSPSMLSALPAFSRQRGASVALLGEKILKDWLLRQGLSEEDLAEGGEKLAAAYDHEVMFSDDFSPDYLRKPQAERERKAGLLEDPGQHSLKKLARG